MTRIRIVTFAATVSVLLAFSVQCRDQEASSPAPLAERIRLEVGAPVMAVGNIYEPDHVNSILAAGRADLCLLARPHLGVPHWTLRAAAELGYTDQWWPLPYRSGKRQLERIYERQRDS